LHALPGQTAAKAAFDFHLNGTTNSAISSQTLWTIFWLAKTSNNPISLMTTLVVNP